MNETSQQIEITEVYRIRIAHLVVVLTNQWRY